jgi:hypothetical protein
MTQSGHQQPWSKNAAGSGWHKKTVKSRLATGGTFLPFWRFGLGFKHYQG